MPLSPSTHLGRYEIRSLLGKGGMGEVYLAQDSNLKRLVAIKLLPTDVTEDHTRLRRFQREAYAASSLNHPNILTIYEIGEAEGHRFIASEYVDGESLRQHMTHKRMELKDILDTTVQVASALAAADHEGIVHRDIKPENIMLRSDGYVKVLDFGLAKLIDKEPAPDSGETKKEAPTLTMTHTSAGIVLGTIAYMSPEQARGREVDSRSDIWSLGVVVYEMLTGTRPFEGESPNDVIAAILKTEPVPLSDACPTSPQKLNDIVSKMLRKDQKERYQSTKELLVDLEDLKQDVEFAVKLESGKPPGSTVQVGSNNSGAAVSDLRHAEATSRNNERPLTHSISGGDNLVVEVKRHKLGIIFALATLAILLAVAVYFRYPSTGSQTITSLAVLPFENGSGDQNLDYFSEGLSEDLLDRLSQLPELKVIARSSSFKFKSTDPDPQQVARALGVQALVMGRVVQRGDDLQVRVELVDGRDKTQMWGGQYSGKPADIQTIQAEITNKISDKLRPKLSQDDQRRVRSISTEDNDAYELYLRGRFFSNKLTESDLKESIKYFNQAIQKDPKYALAYAGLANSYLVLGANYLSSRETYPQAKTYAKKAVELNTDLAEGHYAMAATNYYYDWNFAEAEKELNHTLEINPNYAMAYIMRSNINLAKGQPSEAILQIRRALELDPFSLLFNNKLSTAYYFARDYKRSLDQVKKTLELEPSASFLYSDMGVLYAQLGMYNEAVAACQKGIILQKDNPSALASLGLTYSLWGKKNEALWVLDNLNHLAETRYVPPYSVASIYAALGDNDKAITWLEKANSERSFMIYLSIDPVFDKLRSDKRYKALIERVNLQQ